MKNGLVKLGRVALCVAACHGSAHAGPTSPQVVAGQATFSQQGNVFSITNTPGAIINWQSFNVNAGEVTRFIQQGSDSAVLNRIVGQDPSRILGALQSNGKVFLINPNGIVFGQGARVDVNGLVASTLNISDSDFLAGNKTFTAGGVAGAIRNDGAITTPGGGKVFLIAPSVENTGIISAPNGEVVLAAGRSVKLVDANNPDLDVVVSAPQDRAINLGQLVSSGGRIGIYGALVNQRGVVNANSAVVGENGKIVLKASGDTVLEAGSVTSATGAGKGGEIQLLGKRVGSQGDALVDASGALGGGTVLAGGDYQGKNPALPNAQQTWFGKDARIRADALQAGEGGKVVLWSDGATGAYGSISARGAGLGNGGLVETSGHALSTGGIRVDAAGGKQGGKSGTWLLDPWNIVVRTGGETLPGNADMFDKMPGDEDAVVDPTALRDTNANIVLQARNNLSFQNDLETAYSVRAEAGNELSVDARIRAGGDIDLRAVNKITLGEGGELRSANYIDLKADRMALYGRVRGENAGNPIVSFNPFNNSVPISVSSTDTPGALTLKPSRLADMEAFGINLGSSAHIGTISIDSSLDIGAHLSLDTGNAVHINAPVVLGDDGSRFTATLHPHLGGGLIQVGTAGSVNAGKKIALAGASVRVLGDLTSEGIAVDAGASGIEMQEGADLEASGELILRSNGFLSQNGAASIRAGSLLASGAQVQMLGVNRVGTLAGGASTGNFRFNWRDAMAVGTAGGVSGLRAASEVDLTGGVLTANAGIEAAAVFVDADLIKGSGVFKANFLDLASRGGIGETASPLRTSAQVLTAWNSQVGGAPINIVNDRAVILRDVVQAGSGNTGSVSVESFDGLTVTATSSEGQGVKTKSGDISLVTHSPLTIAGNVSTESGNIRLLADNNGPVTITGSAHVASGSGNINITGGSTSIAAGTVVVSSPDKLSVTNTNEPPPPPPPPPSPQLDTCLGNPGTSGCGAVLEAKTRECIANMDGPQCGQVLPTPATCQNSPGALGCGVVLERAALLACIANPKGQGCGAILPSYDVCRNDQNRLGCAPVIEARQKLDACIQNPKGAGCGEILPPIDACKADGSILGCAPVLEARRALEACIANPKGVGCGEILPTIEVCKADGNVLGCAPVLEARRALEACIANPKGALCGEILPPFDACKADGNLLGCAPVLLARQQLDACIVNPKGAGCGEILPPLEQCRTNGTVLGCVPVLARAAFDACLANPAGSGCAAVLPALAVCKATPGEEGCTQVLQLTFNACLVNPGDTSCTGILPTLSQCVGDKTRAGCQVVLPTLQQCIGSPTLQGCSVQLPKLETCAANPATPGCEAVLPKPDFCATHPGDASCQVFQPAPATGEQGKTPVTTAQQVALNLINTRIPTSPERAPEGPAPSAAGGGGDGGGDGRKASDKQAGPAQGPNTGAKNEKPAAKMYCN